jgi:two-component system, OmpR family, sensor histidine kinase MprB
MSFRLRLTLYAAVAIAVTVAAASFAVWVVAKHELLGQVDQALLTQARVGRPSGPYSAIATMIVGPDGTQVAGAPLPITKSVQQVVSGRRDGYYTETTVQNFHLREFVAPLEGGGAIVTAQDLAQTDSALSRIKFWIFLIGGIAIAAAAALAAFVATAALRPVRRLTAAAETVAATGDLSERVVVHGSDELGRLATRFNAMLIALEESVGRQRRLVADASHELRTPLTSVRTNVDLLREGKLPPEEAQRALAEASVELAALTTLLSDLVELARGEERKLRIEEVQLDELVSIAVDRAKARAPQITFLSSLSPTLVRADPVLLERAVSNLLDNAVKWSPDGGPVEVTVRAGEVVVADHGPGVAEEDIPRVFDRFYRAAAARAKPGAGLGLAIVREAAEAHGGRASVESTSRGARFKLTLPATA